VADGEEVNPSDAMTVIVPDGHPMAGVKMTLYPESGATTYTEGELEVVSASAHKFRQTIRDLRQTVNTLLEKKP
jgi:hypothetical protein